MLVYERTGGWVAKENEDIGDEKREERTHSHEP